MPGLAAGNSIQITEAQVFNPSLALSVACASRKLVPGLGAGTEARHPDIGPMCLNHCIIIKRPNVQTYMNFKNKSHK